MLFNFAFAFFKKRKTFSLRLMVLKLLYQLIMFV